MSDRVPSDHDAVTSHRVHLAAIGRTGRLRVPLPDGVDAAPDDLLRLSLDGDTYHARVSTTLDGDRAIEGAFDNARLARERDAGTDHLADWLESVGASDGDPLLLDVVTQGFKLGLREPGQRVVYTATEPPAGSLSDIARDLEK